MNVFTRLAQLIITVLQLYQENPNEIGGEIYWLSTNTQRKKSVMENFELKLTKLKNERISKQIKPQQQNKRKKKEGESRGN